LGVVADHIGFAAVFCAAGALVAGTALLAPRERLVK